MFDDPFGDDSHRVSQNRTANAPRHLGYQPSTVTANRSRRSLLRLVQDSDVRDLHELVDAITEANSINDEAHSTVRERIANELHHVHLPKLADADVIEYDARNHQIRYLGDTHRDDAWD